MSFEKLELVSQIALSERGEAQIQSCFRSLVEFHYLNSVNDLQNLINQFKKRKTVLKEEDKLSRESTVDDADSANVFGENNRHGQRF